MASRVHTTFRLKGLSLPGFKNLWRWTDPLKNQLKAHLPGPIVDILRSIYGLYRGTYLFQAPYCLLDSRRKLIYITMPKVACTSIKASFYEREFADNYSVKDGHPVHTIITADEPHITRENRSLHARQDVDGYFRFTFVRNPFSRLYACYRDKCVNGALYQHYLFGYLRHERVRDFDGFARRVCRVPDFYAEIHFRGQYFHIHEHHKGALDFIGRYETLAEDFEPIREKYGLKPLPHFNQTQRHPDEWMAHYTRQTAALVYRRYRRDFDTWYPQAYDELLAYLDRA